MVQSDVRIILGDKAIQHIVRGTREASKLVSVTYGPHGGSVLHTKRGRVVSTTDGATALRAISSSMGINLVRSASLAVEDKWGDGTSTTAILAQAVIESGLMRSGDGLEAAKRIEGEWPQTRENLTAMAEPADHEALISVGLRASKGDEEVVRLLVGALESVGEYGTVVLERGIGLGIEVAISEGVRLKEKWASHNLAPAGGEAGLEGPLVAVLRGQQSKFEDIAPILEEASQWPGRPIIVFTEGIRGVALDTVVQNRETMNLMAIEYQGNPKNVLNWLEDIAAITNATMYDCGVMGEFKSEWLGSARKITVSVKGTTITPYEGSEVSERVDKRIGELRALAEGTSHDHDRDSYNRRAAELDGGLCVVKVGGATDLEAIERRARVEDTLHALNAAMTTGVVPGAGIALAQAGEGAILGPAFQVPMKVLEGRGGVEDPGWDPLGVVLGAASAALSVALQVLRTGAVLIPSGGP